MSPTTGEFSLSSEEEEGEAVNRCEVEMPASDFQLLKNQKQKLKRCEADVGEIVKASERLALLQQFTNAARLPRSPSPDCEGPSQMRVPLSSDYEGSSQLRLARSLSTGSKTHLRNCNERPGRCEMLI